MFKGNTEFTKKDFSTKETVNHISKNFLMTVLRLENEKHAKLNVDTVVDSEDKTIKQKYIFLYNSRFRSYCQIIEKA